MAIKFEIPSTIQANAKIISAVLSFYRISGDSDTLERDDFQVVAIDEAWNVNEITWNKMPVYLPHKKIASITGGVNNSWRDLDITPAIQGFTINPEKNHGFMFETHVEGRYIKVNSSECSDAALRPKLVITYDNDDITNIEHSTNDLKTRILFKKIKESYLIFITTPGYHRVSVYTVSGRNLATFTVYGKKQWYKIPKIESVGMHIIHLVSPAGSLTKKINLFQQKM